MAPVRSPPSISDEEIVQADLLGHPRNFDIGSHAGDIEIGPSDLTRHHIDGGRIGIKQPEPDNTR